MATKRERRTDRRKNDELLEKETSPNRFFKNSKGETMTDEERKKLMWKWICFFISIGCIWFIINFGNAS